MLEYKLKLNNYPFWAIAMFACANIEVFAGEVGLAFDSKYVSEGRNNLPEGGITWLWVNHGLNDNFSVALVYGLATKSSVNYDELNVSFEYANLAGNLAYSLSYTRLEFFEDNFNDNEFAINFSWNGWHYFTPRSTLVYSTEANGAFLELGLEKEYNLSDVLSIVPFVTIDFDFGYANDRYKGHNHSSIGAEFVYQTQLDVALSFILELNVGGRAMKKVIGNTTKQTWFGVHATYHY